MIVAGVLAAPAICFGQETELPRTDSGLLDNDAIAAPTTADRTWFLRIGDAWKA